MLTHLRGRELGVDFAIDRDGTLMSYDKPPVDNYAPSGREEANRAQLKGATGVADAMANAMGIQRKPAAPLKFLYHSARRLTDS